MKHIVGGVGGGSINGIIGVYLNKTRSLFAESYDGWPLPQPCHKKMEFV